MKKIMVALLLTGFAIAKKKPVDPADYPLFAHVVSSMGGTSEGFSVRSSDGNYVNGDIDSSTATVQFQIGDLLYTAGYGCRKFVQVGTDVHARIEKNSVLYVLTDNGQKCKTHIRSTQEVSKPH